MRVRRIVDLALAIDADTQTYPGDPTVHFEEAATISEDGFNILGIRMGSQTGTNCDAPYHFRADGARIDEVDLALFVGPGVVIDATGKRAREPITVEDVTPYLGRVGPGTVVVLHTGWSRHYRTPEFFDHPYLSAAAGQILLDHGVRTFCMDMLNVDETPDETHPGVGFPVHHLVAAQGGIIVENLTGIENIDFDHPFISVLPLKLTGADGSPTRAVAMDLQI